MRTLFLRRLLLVIVVSSSFLSSIIAQNSTITGKVSDEKGAPVARASVNARDHNIGVTTNEDGVFSISVPSTVKALAISSVGYVTQEVPATTAGVSNIILIASIASLNDVVVVGYGTAKRKDVTGAITTVTSKDFVQGLVTNPTDQIQGKVAGLVITKPDGDPNSPVVIRLRGQTSLTGGQNPLIVVDGVILDDAAQISNIPPGDIVSYDVLKDASATSIYGARGANGVIIINTRKGRAGKAQIDYSGFVSSLKPRKNTSCYLLRNSLMHWKSWALILMRWTAIIMVKPTTGRMFCFAQV